MTTPNRVTQDKLDLLIKLRQERETLRRIATVLGVQHGTVRYWVKKLQAEGWTFPSPKYQSHLVTIPKPPLSDNKIT